MLGDLCEVHVYDQCVIVGGITLISIVVPSCLHSRLFMVMIIHTFLFINMVGIIMCADRNKLVLLWKDNLHEAQNRHKVYADTTIDRKCVLRLGILFT